MTYRQSLQEHTALGATVFRHAAHVGFIHTSPGLTSRGHTAVACVTTGAAFCDTSGGPGVSSTRSGRCSASTPTGATTEHRPWAPDPPRLMMYTVTRGPSKLVTQRRTGPTQQIESKLNDLKIKSKSWLTSNAPPPKIVFNKLNGRRYHTAPAPKTDGLLDGFTPAHEENVKFVSEAWQEVEQKMGDAEQEGREPISATVQYSEKTTGLVMKNFVPIDLEEWWAQRFLANIANLS